MDKQVWLDAFLMMSVSIFITLALHVQRAGFELDLGAFDLRNFYFLERHYERL